ncbi:MAG: hypothetical protein O2791_04070, partial [Bacteroidetes bacterium]|nr:hypothetical protein [Bacteroidota bacterium]
GNFPNLVADTYMIYVVDGAGCVDSLEIIVTPPLDVNANGICDALELQGCLDEWACNYNPYATLSNGTCEYLSCAGCTDPSACNYDMVVTEDDGSCEYPAEFYDCDGNCLNDADGDGVCDELEIFGCMDQGACNYNPSATEMDTSCLSLDALGICGGTCSNDGNENGICDTQEDCQHIGMGFWSGLPLNVYSSSFSYDEGSLGRLELMVGEGFGFGLVLSVPQVFTDEVTGSSFQVLSWQNLEVTNHPPGTLLAIGSDSMDGSTQQCITFMGSDFATEEGTWEVMISGELLLNIFGTPFSIGVQTASFVVDVVPNPNGVGGCTYLTATNFMPWATFDNGECVFEGCTDPSALNYSAVHSQDDGSCIYSDPNCTLTSSCPDLNDDGVIGTPDLLLLLSGFGDECE